MVQKPRRHAIAASVLAAVMVAGTGVGQAQVDVASKPNTAGAAGAHRVTLVTGDVVLVGPGQPGREPVSLIGKQRSSDYLQILRQHGHTYVIPEKARPYVLAKRLDPTLFDVTTLIEQGFDDKRSKTLPLILDRSQAKATIKGAKRTRLLKSINAEAVRVDKQNADTFWNAIDTKPARTAKLDSGVDYIWLSQKVQASLDQSVKQIGAPAAWAKGFTGEGIKVAIADTGIDATHPDLQNNVVEAKNFSESPEVTDHFGHGTHVASIVASNDTKYRGVAPDATLLSAKVLDDSGGGYWDGIIAGMEWAVAQGANVVNLSLGGTDSPGVDPVEETVNRLTQQTGTLFVISAGNDGQLGEQTIGSPGSADEALTVGAVDKQDELADFSSRGPRVGDGGLKPDVTAPGVDIVAAKAAGTELGDPVGDDHVSLSGTSMAAPHVAGAAAILLQQHPSWKANEVRASLMSTAKPHADLTEFEQGAGRIDVAHATTEQVHTDTGKLELGYFKWPHDNPAPVTKPITYTNTGTSPVTLELAVTGNLTIDQTALTIAAQSSATVNVRLDPAGMPNGVHEGALTATNGDGQLRTPIAWYLEPELYDLTINAVDRHGEPITDLLNIADTDDGQWYPLNPFIPIENGKVTLRLPKGAYSVGVTAAVNATDESLPEFLLIHEPNVDLQRDTTVDLDGTKAREVTLDVQNGPRTNTHTKAFGLVRVSANGASWNGFGGTAHDTNRRLFAVPSAKAKVGKLEFSTEVRREAPPITMNVVGAKGLDLAPRAIPFAPRFDGKARMPVDTFPGGDVEGGVALIAHDQNSSFADEARAAAAAGAKLALFYDPSFPGRSGEWWWGEPPYETPSIMTDRAAAAKLLALVEKGPVRLDVTGIARSPYVYDLAIPVEGRIPADLTYRVRKSELAKVAVSFGAHAPSGGETSEVRSAITPLGSENGGNLIPQFDTPSTRTDYILANQMKWTQVILPVNLDDSSGVSLAELPRAYRPGSRHDVRWFHPVATHSLPAGNDLPWLGTARRTEGALEVVMNAFADQRDRVDNSSADTHVQRLYRAGKLVGETPDRFGFYELAAGADTFRLEQESTRSFPWWKYSTKLASAWTFSSKGTGTEKKPEQLPLLLAEYDVPTADASSQVRTGRLVPLKLAVRHQDGAKSARIARVKLELSYDDGATWESARLLRTGRNTYKALVVHPQKAAGGAVTLRVDVSDQAGNRLQQTVTRAYGLK
ncbi:S8 family peptidase [Tenggerimyces flavus]|uniref:S8 family serine peptidase n=1 Tax=Tenggerimyces flavus TaxID=1708749 RepID=A0ABV7Y3U8_9ACTN|nr:S8 family serine peptidase [Tenggerimyces flavus]MBM7790796.1 subtilisin family serine protease [Tenggerimyces flavus]